MACYGILDTGSEGSSGAALTLGVAGSGGGAEVDLNLLYGTVTNDARNVLHDWSDPTAVNDGDDITSASIEWTSGDWTHILNADLGAPYEATSFYWFGGDGGDDHPWVCQYWDGAAWQDITGTWSVSGLGRLFTFDAPVTAQIFAAGYQGAGIHVAYDCNTWAINGTGGAGGSTSIRWRLLLRSETELNGGHPVTFELRTDGGSYGDPDPLFRTIAAGADTGWETAELGTTPATDDFSLTVTSDFYVDVQIDADDSVHAKWWQGSEPGSWMLEDTLTGQSLDHIDIWYEIGGSGPQILRVYDVLCSIDGGAFASVFSPTTDLTDEWPDDWTVAPSVEGGHVSIVCITTGPGVWIDFDNDGFGTGDFDNVSADTISWKITRGAPAEVTGASSPGSATVVLQNVTPFASEDNLYNPYNEAGSLYGLLTDGKALWIGVSDEGYLSGGTGCNGLFGGRITDITPIPAGGAVAAPTVEIVAEDALGWYSRTPIRLDYAEGRSHRALRLAALDAAGETRYELDNEIRTMPLSHVDDDLAGLLEDLNRANGTRHFIRPHDDRDELYRYVTYNRQHGLDGVSAAALDASSDHVTGTDGWRLTADTVINRQRATSTPVLFTPATFTVWQADTLPIGLTDAAPYEVIVEFADYVKDATLNLASTGDTVISAFEPFATGGKISLSVGAGDTATVTALSVEGSLARFLPREGHEANDTTSQAGPRGIRAGAEIDGEYVGALASAAGIAEHVVWRYGNPQLRPTLTVENWLPTQFTLDIGDVIDVTSPQLAMNARLFEIIGLTHEGRMAVEDGAVHHVVTYVLQESRVQSDPGWFVLDTSELDSADILAY